MPATFIASLIGRGVALLTPTADGTVNQALVTDGAGTLSFATVAASDHGALGGLADDDHSQYALLAGRAGGQTIYGGNAANDDITIEGTSHATKTTSYVLLNPSGGNVGIGTTAPSQPLHIIGNTASNAVGPLLVAANASGLIGTALTLDATAVAGGEKYSFISTGPDASGGAGDFAVYNGTQDRYVFRAGNTGGYIAGVNKTTELGQISVYPYTASTKGLVIQGAASQTANLFEWQNSTGTGLGAITNDGNVGIGTTAPGGSSTAGNKVLSLANGTPPVGGVANQVSLYSADVTASAELFVLDEAGVATQLSSHDGSQLDRHAARAQDIGVIPLKLTWTFNADSQYAGVRTKCDVGLAMRAIESLWQQVTGKPLTLIEEQESAEKLVWAENQKSQSDARMATQTEWDERNAERLGAMRRRAALPFWMRDPKPAALEARPATIEIKPEPQWLINAGAA